MMRCAFYKDHPDTGLERIPLEAGIRESPSPGAGAGEESQVPASPVRAPGMWGCQKECLCSKLQVMLKSRELRFC